MLGQYPTGEVCHKLAQYMKRLLKKVWVISQIWFNRWRITHVDSFIYLIGNAHRPCKSFCLQSRMPFVALGLSTHWQTIFRPAPVNWDWTMSGVRAVRKSSLIACPTNCYANSWPTMVMWRAWNLRQPSRIWVSRWMRQTRHDHGTMWQGVEMSQFNPSGNGQWYANGDSTLLVLYRYCRMKTNTAWCCLV